ncbi:HNH/ENDO VII family nuclease [uncultured Tateyamaria sp.]|uniref:HNH/ENDO VII family nuclease n=1 Tax=uncultured Tateyamaria sp. TaxID=455651 RepID=UPI002629877C|nr:HNH/ENDO VII family nuclease [uncultured Tateyamaria sp.]
MALALPTAVSDASFAPIAPLPSTSTALLTSSARAPPLSRISAHPEHDRIDGLGSTQFTPSGLQIAELGLTCQQTKGRADCDAFMAASLEYGVEAAVAWGVGAAIPGDKTVMSVLGWVSRRGGDDVKRAVDTVMETAAGVATNRTATNADVAENFQQNRHFWTQEPVQLNGNKVFQRNDLIDPNRVSEWTVRGQTVTGTNIERMAAGRAPIGPDGNSVNLHHLTQRQDGAIAEVTQTLHSSNHGILHMPNTVPSSINRSQFNTWSRNYWKDRASNWE